MTDERAIIKLGLKTSRAVDKLIPSHDPSSEAIAAVSTDRHHDT